MTRIAGLEPHSLKTLARALARLKTSFDSLPGDEETAGEESLEALLFRVADRMGDNYPYFHPLYAGQMLKPPHPVARLAYALAQYINPNNHALDGGRASSAMEIEAVQKIAAMFGWSTYLGHLTGGGTMANLEALWVSRELQPGAVVASSQAHYTHSRLAGVLGMPSVSVAIDSKGRMDLEELERMLDDTEVSVVVATTGTTGLGSVDPVADLIALRKRRPFRLHIDAAYGGYFTLAENLPQETKTHFNNITHADSIVIDPHKHGLQPYGCGCVLFSDPGVGQIYKHDSKYTYFTSDALHLGEISLECSRPGASAVALWATQQLLPYTAGGEFAQSLEGCHRAALTMYEWLKAHEAYVPILEPELDIVVYGIQAPRASVASARGRRLFAIAASRDLHLAMATFPRQLLDSRFPGMEWDADDVTCLRSCLMKPVHEAWVPRITELLHESWKELA
jgi:glutamate/tyrosine decarboxylase-like PLP-dependent enzyme